MKFTTLAFSALALGTTTVFAALKAGECEVCIGVVNKFIAEAKTAGASSSPEISDKIDWENTKVRVFGYGSLIWKPKFEYSRKYVGYIAGYVRRFWQGDGFYRGTPESLGRVATIVPCAGEDSGVLEDGDECKSYGVAYELDGERQIMNAMKHLNLREGVHGGYEFQVVDFFQYSERQKKEDKVLVVIATENNKQYLGRDTRENIADVVCNSVGRNGTNYEYVNKIALWQRQNLPEVQDTHLYEIDSMATDCQRRKEHRDL